jgi:hypothetical protein
MATPNSTRIIYSSSLLTESYAFLKRLTVKHSKYFEKRKAMTKMLDLK